MDGFAKTCHPVGKHRSLTVKSVKVHTVYLYKTPEAMGTMMETMGTMPKSLQTLQTAVKLVRGREGFPRRTST